MEAPSSRAQSLAPLSVSVPPPPPRLQQPALVPASLERQQHTRILAALGRIVSISVSGTVRENGHNYYVVDAHGTARAVDTTGSPTSETLTQSKHRFDEFAGLRRDLFYHAQSGHSGETRPCAFCTSVMTLVTHEAAPPGNLKRVFSSNDTLYLELEDFLTAVLQLAMQATRVAPGRSCQGREMVPLLVKQFLLGDDGEAGISQGNFSNLRSTVPSLVAALR